MDVSAVAALAARTATGAAASAAAERAAASARAASPASVLADSPASVLADSPAAKAGREFESMMLGFMFEQMFEGVGTSGAFGGGQAERTWRGFMLQEYAQALTDTGGVGIAPLVEAEIARLYGEAGREE
jgi:peptidoglycan hydrolase FlgJ